MANGTAQLVDGSAQHTALAVFYLLNRARMHSKPLSDLILLKPPIFQKEIDFINVQKAQLVFSTFLAISRSALSVAILIIFSIRAKKKVIWSNARRIVALVKNIHPMRDRSFVNFPGKTMRSHGCPVHLYFPVSIFVCVSSPIPAPLAFGNVFPKSFLACVKNLIALQTAKSASVLQQFRLRNVEHYSALFAISFWHKQQTRQPNRVKQADESLTTEPAGKFDFIFRAVSTLATG